MNSLVYDIKHYIAIPRQLNNILYFLIVANSGFIANFSFLISEVLFILNFLYIFIVVVYKSYTDSQKLKNINNYIRPIMKQYHESYYNYA